MLELECRENYQLGEIICINFKQKNMNRIFFGSKIPAVILYDKLLYNNKDMTRVADPKFSSKFKNHLPESRTKMQYH